MAEVGFIHCGWRHQVERVANAIYRGGKDLVVLTIDPGRVPSEIRAESGGGVELFPHIYGPLPVDAVVDVEPLEPAAGGRLFVPRTSWLSPKLEVRPSSIDGLGLFARVSVKVGEPVAVMGGRVLTDEQFAHYVAGAVRWSAAAIDDGLNVLQSEDDPLSRGNHSCDPNLWMADELTVVARRSLTASDEATVDYALMTVDESWTMACHCRMPACRGEITGSDWQDRRLQSRYRGHFAPFIQRRIELAQP